MRARLNYTTSCYRGKETSPFAVDEAQHKTCTPVSHTTREGTGVPAAFLRGHTAFSRSSPLISCLFTIHLNAGGLGWVAARRSAEVSTEDISFSCVSCNLLASLFVSLLSRRLQAGWPSTLRPPAVCGPPTVTVFGLVIVTTTTLDAKQRRRWGGGEVHLAYARWEEAATEHDGS